ncbi:MAG: electron transporter RnfD [Ruminococcus sp.]|nr:electron transporter RnfD [Ruminococcus sp.]
MEKRFIPASDRAIRYMGRIDRTLPDAPKIVFAGTMITLRFVGTELSAVICNHKFYNKMELGLLVDGKEEKVCFDTDRERFSLPLVSGLERREHEITLFKRQDATHYFDFFGFETDADAELLPPRPRSDRRIECYGDSVSAGAVCEAVDYVASNDPDNTDGVYDNAYHSYSMITARNLGAEIHNIAQGGIAIFDRTGYYHSPETIGMETAYDKVIYFPEECGYSDWDFSLYTPQVVILAVGQNDQHREQGDDPDITDPDYRRKWKDRYEEIIRSLRSHYPKAQFIMLLTVLMHDPSWDRALDEIVSELTAEGDGKISHLTFTRCGKATPGHPRLPEQYEMASELTAYISRLGDSLWE